MFFLMSMFMSACGSKGDLYQIEESEETQQVIAEDSQQSSDKKEKKPQ